MGTREDPDHGRTRTVLWADGSESDLAVIVVATAAVALCAAGIVAAIELHGLPRALAVGFALLAGAYAALLLVPVLVVLGGVHLVKGMAAARPSAAQRASWVIAAALVGAALGVDAYGVGVPGLLTGPILLAVAIIAVQRLPNMSARARRRVLALTTVAGLSALLLGLTIFA